MKFRPLFLLAAVAALPLSSPAYADDFFSGGTSSSADLKWCNHSSGQLHVGDFNGDGLTDMLCHDTKTGRKWVDLADSLWWNEGKFAGTDWEGGLGWCNHPTAQLHVGDFNGDGRSDLLCHDTSTGYKWIDLASSDATFTGTNWEAGIGWCNHPTAQLHVGDFNNDRRSDLLCHDTSTGYKWVSFSRN